MIVSPTLSTSYWKACHGPVNYELGMRIDSTIGPGVLRKEEEVRYRGPHMARLVQCRRVLHVLYMFTLTDVPAGARQWPLILDHVHRYNTLANTHIHTIRRLADFSWSTGQEQKDDDCIESFITILVKVRSFPDSTLSQYRPTLDSSEDPLASLPSL